MKISLALGQHPPPDRATAWACLTTNVVLPGSGSLVAGKKIGYAQLALAFCGVAVTTLFGIRFLLWYARNWARLRQTADDPLAVLGEVFHQLRWPGLGIVIFIVAIGWAFITSLQILGATRSQSTRDTPPRLS